MDIRSTSILLIITQYSNRSHGIQYSLTNTTWTSNSSKPPEGVQEINFAYVNVPDSSLDLFAKLLDKAESLNLYRSSVSRLCLPVDLLNLCITNPVTPIEIVIASNESYSLKAIEMINFDKLPTQISHLQSLQHFTCRSVPVLDLDFELLARMRNLTSLTMILTSTKSITFSKPRRFPLLRMLNFWGNHLTTLNATSWDFPSLETLDLSYNEFTVLPKQVASFGNLTHLNIKSNQIKFIDMHTFAGLRRLAVLDLQDNHISSITGELQLSKLSELWLGENRLEELDVSRWYLPALIRINLSGNFLKSVAGFTECFGAASFIHLNEGQWDCNWLEELGRSIKGMAIGYVQHNSSFTYCWGNRHSMTKRSFIEIKANGTIQQHPL